MLVSPQRLTQPALVGKPATLIAEKAGITVPHGTRALIAPLAGVGRDFPLSIEKLCPVLSYYVVRDWREGCERCKEILRYGGMGHTMSIHSRNEQVILEFGLHKPAYRICVNTPTTHGSIGLTTGLDPAMTLGCGGFGGNITSDNISPRHLLNIKRLAYELRPAHANRRPRRPLPPPPSLPGRAFHNRRCALAPMGFRATSSPGASISFFSPGDLLRAPRPRERSTRRGRREPISARQVLLSWISCAKTTCGARS